MSNEITEFNKSEIANVDTATYSALKNSIFPGAKDESIEMVLAYCRARKLDPLQKPVHIVPMWIVDAKTKEGGMRDIVMPGIALYRIQAQRSGQYAGQSDPDFGEDITETLSGVKVTYPKWCKIIVRKQMQNGEIVEFAAKEFWKENYATQKKDTDSPNSMWKKRPYAQLAKCTEAQALRKAFPDILDHTPTAEEMEGKHFESHGETKSAELNKSFKLYDTVRVNQETGEVIEKPEPVSNSVQNEPVSNCPFTFDEILSGFETAKDLTKIAELASFISQMEITPEQRSQLTKAYREAKKEAEKA